MARTSDHLTGYLDARNVLNIKNINSVWATTGTISNGALFENQWIADSNTYATFGRNNGFYRTTDGALTLPTTDAACAQWSRNRSRLASRPRNPPAR